MGEDIQYIFVSFSAQSRMCSMQLSQTVLPGHIVSITGDMHAVWVRKIMRSWKLEAPLKDIHKEIIPFFLLHQLKQPGAFSGV